MWYKLYQENKGKVVGVLIGNKSDIIDEERIVKYEDAKQFAKEYGLEYFEGSAKKDKYIKKAMTSLLKNIIESKALYNSLSSIDSVQANNDTISLLQNHQTNKKIL